MGTTFFYKYYTKEGCIVLTEYFTSSGYKGGYTVNGVACSEGRMKLLKSKLDKHYECIKDFTRTNHLK